MLSIVRAFSALLLILPVVGLVACADNRQDTRETISPEESFYDAPLSQVEEPPAQPPTAIVEGVTLQPLSSIWREPDSDFVETNPTGMPEGVPKLTAPSQLVLGINSGVTPEMVVVRSFTSFDGDGLPSDEIAAQACSKPEDGGQQSGGSCTTTVGESEVTIVADLDVRTLFVTVEVFYNIPAMDLEQPYDIVTYGLYA